MSLPPQSTSTTFPTHLTWRLRTLRQTPVVSSIRSSIRGQPKYQVGILICVCIWPLNLIAIGGFDAKMVALFVESVLASNPHVESLLESRQVTTPGLPAQKAPILTHTIVASPLIRSKPSSTIRKFHSSHIDVLHQLTSVYLASMPK